MSKEQLSQNKEQSNQTYRLDEKLDSAEKIYSGIDKARWIRDHLIGLKKPENQRPGGGRSVENKLIKESSAVNRYILPGMGNLDLTDAKEEKYQLQGVLARCKETPNRRVSWVKQGTMLEMPRDKTPFALATMSECSFLVGIDENDMIAAHISFSLKNQITEVLDYCEDKGVPKNNMYLVTNTGLVTTGADKGGFLGEKGRLTTRKERRNLPIPDDNICEFAYEKSRDEQGAIEEKLQIVFANPDVIYTTEFKQNTSGQEKPLYKQGFPENDEELDDEYLIKLRSHE